jgi:hypothetical protein
MPQESPQDTSLVGREKDKDAVRLGKKRWRSKTKAERVAHANMMVTARKNKKD